MSSLFKNNFVSLNSNPVVIDVNKFNAFDSNQNKVIRTINNKANEETDKQTDDQAENQNNFTELSVKAANDEMINTAKEMATQIIADAQSKAEQIIAKATSEMETIFSEAEEKGLETGNKEAMKRADVYLAGLQKEQDELISNNLKQQEAYLNSLEPQIIDIVCELIHSITNVCIKDFKPVILHMINEALKDTDSSKEYIIKVSEDNYDYIIANKTKIYGSNNPSIQIEVFQDAKLRKDQCIIDTDNGIIDLSLDVQMENLITAMKLLATRN